MAASTTKIVQLRQLLAERFRATALAPEEAFLTGLPALDEIGVPRAALSEVVSSSASGPGGSLLLYGLLHAVLRRGERVILVDGKNSFDPQSLPPAELDRLLWVRCREAREAMKAADLAVRDGNIPLVILWLTLNPPAELRRVPATAWQRLQMLAEKSAVTLLAFTAQAQIGCARLRISAGAAFPLEKLQAERGELLPGLQLRLERRRLERRAEDDEELRRAVCA
jgi:hypothetical protein